MPVVLLSFENHDISAERILSDIRSFDAHDDVFCADFLSPVLILQTPFAVSNDLSELQRALKGSSPLLGDTWDIEKVYINVRPSQDQIPSGPYFLYKGQIHEAWKLYSDPLESFQTTVVPAGDGSYR